MKTGLIVNVYRASGIDCTNGGITSKYKTLTLLGPEVSGPFAPDEDRPALTIVKRKLFGGDYYHARPADVPTTEHLMFGGNFVYTSDSRFPCPYPIPVHDRKE